MLEYIRDLIKKSFMDIGLTVGDDWIIFKSDVADVACIAAFKLSRELRRSPVEIAEELCSKLKPPDIFSRIEAVRGYLNFYYNYEKLSDILLREIISGRFFDIDLGHGAKVVVDYSCPNPGKPMHLGHIRSTIIGEALSRLLEFTGFNVVRSNYMNDRGLHMGKLIAAIELWGLPPLDEIEDPEKALMDLYVRFHKASEEDPKLIEKAREWVKRIDMRDPKALEMLNRIFKASWKGFSRIYDLLDVRFDEVVRETEVFMLGKEIVKEALDKGIAFIGENGEVVANLKPHGLPNCVILRSDGTSLYITSDFGLMKYRFNKHRFDRAIYVTGSEQKLHFKQLFKIMELLGYDYARRCIHVPFGLIQLKEGKMSTREGRVVFLKDVLEKGIGMAEKEVLKRNPDISGDELKDIARKVGIGAVKYAILSVENEKDIKFDWGKILKFEGFSGPYLLYTMVRIKSILRKAGSFEYRYTISNLSDEEKMLLKKLLLFRLEVERAVEELSTLPIALYAYDLAKQFSNYYHRHRILANDVEIRSYRLTLISAIAQVMEKALNILSLEAPERM